MKKDNNNLLQVLISNQEIEIGKTVEIQVDISKRIGKIEDFKVWFNQKGRPPSIKKQMIKIREENNFETYRAKVRFNELGNYFFFFYITIDGKQKAIKMDRKDEKRAKILNPEEEAPYWRILVTNEFSTPKWAKDAIFYQLVVDRFKKGNIKNQEKKPYRNYRTWQEPLKWERGENGEFNNNDFRGGNIRGITERLSYLKQLGVKVIYMSPINQNYDRYDGYATIDHMQIDDDLGDFEDLKELHEKANELGMYIILDIAFNHCSIDNPIFQEAKNNLDSQYRNWFLWDENGNYKYWYDFKDMPLFNLYSKGYQNYVYNKDGCVIDKWKNYVDGFRLDLAELFPLFFLEGMKKRMHRNGNSLFCTGEFWERPPIDVLGEGIDAPTNYPISDPILKFVKYGYHEYLKEQIYESEENYPKTTIDTCLNSLGTHDTPRALTMLSDKYHVEGFRKLWELDKEWSPWHYHNQNGNVRFDTDGFRKFEFENNQLTQEEYQKAKERLKLAVILQYFLPGNPCIFYGEEVGITGYKDPFSRPTYPYGKEDRELLEFYQTIGAFRNQYKGEGSTIEVLESDNEFFSFKRTNEKQKLFVAINRGTTKKMLNIPTEFLEDTKIFVLKGKEEYLLPNGGIVILK